MAQKIVELSVGGSTTKYKINKVNKASIVKYASPDISKGTIEDRLTKLKG